MSDALFERESELSRLRAEIERAVAGSGGTVALEGAPGIGKTALLDVASELAEELGCTVLRARCGEFELDFPFGVARQLFERLVLADSPEGRAKLLAGTASHAASALGIEADAGRQPAGVAPRTDYPFTVVHGLYWLLANMAERGPLVLAVDDAQWCDDASLRLLAYLVPRLAELPVLLLVASRPPDPARAAVLGAILGGPAVERVEPAPLSQLSVAALIERGLSSKPDAKFVAAGQAASGGNPFLLTELVLSLAADRIEPVAANAEAVAALVPATVVHSVLMRMGRMPAPCAELAAACAVLGSEVEPSHAAALAGIAVKEAAGPLAALERAGMLAEERPLRFAHPLLREAVRAELPLARREQLHARAAELMLREGARPEDVAHHLLNGPRAGSAATVVALRAAATSAMGRGAPEAAVTYLARALVEPPGADVQAALRFELGVAGWLSGRDPAVLIEDLRAGLDGAWSPSERATRAIALARALASMGDVPGAFAALDEQLAAAGIDAGEPAARLRAEHASIGLLHPDTRERAAAGIGAWAAPPEGGDLGELLELAVLATRTSLDGSADESAGLAELALANGRLLESEGPDSVAFYSAVLVLMLTDRHELAAACLDQATELARKGGSAFALGSVYAMRSVLAWRRGDITGSEAHARSALEPALAPPFTLPLVLTCLVLALVERGELEAAEAEAARFGAPGDLPEIMQVNMAFFALGALRCAQGEYSEALDHFAELDRRDGRLGILNPAVPWRSMAVEAALRVGDSERARMLAAAENEFATRWGTSTSRGQALRASGTANGTEGIADLRASVTVLEQSPARLERSLALLDLGGALRRAGERREARDHLRAGLELAQSCGAVRIAALAQEELRVAGAKPRRLQFSGADSLTAAERRVAQMAADGMANREIAEALFLSTRTVENHLSHAYRKLDIGSRAELSGALAVVA